MRVLMITCLPVAFTLSCLLACPARPRQPAVCAGCGAAQQPAQAQDTHAPKHRAAQPQVQPDPAGCPHCWICSSRQGRLSSSRSSSDAGHQLQQPKGIERASPPAAAADDCGRARHAAAGMCACTAAAAAGQWRQQQLASHTSRVRSGTARSRAVC
jgi:hypothetical protein